MFALEFLSWCALGFWVLLSLDVRRWWPSRMTLGSSAPPAESTEGAADVTVEVTVIVPARNEAATLPETLPALLEQCRSERRVILVDDRSDDETVARAEEIATACEDARLEIVRKEAPPPGWSGKVSALAAGVEHGRSASLEADSSDRESWLLFTDADIAHREGSIDSLLARARDGELDLVSIMARLRAETFWERVLIPAFVYFFQLLYPFRLVAEPRSRVAAAAGGCVLVRRSMLERIGGIESIRDELIDDVALARRVKRAGGRIWLGLDAGIRSVRVYERLSELWAMISRCAFTQLKRSWTLVVLVLAGLALFFVSPPALVAIAAGAAALGEESALSSALRCGGAAVGAWGLQAIGLLPSVRHHRVPTAYALVLPLAAAVYGLMTWSSAWSSRRGGGPAWRGREADVGR